MTAEIAYEAVDEPMTLTAEAAIDYELASETDKSIAVVDDQADPDAKLHEPGTVEWNAKGTPAEFIYSLEF